MQLIDVNVLIYAHREDAPEHDVYSSWLKARMASPEPIGLSELVLSSFVRIVTNARIFSPPTPLAVAFEFCGAILGHPRSVVLRPTAGHWNVFRSISEASGVAGPIVADAYLAALAIEHGAELVTTDSDFSRFPGLRFRHPLRR